MTTRRHEDRSRKLADYMAATHRKQREMNRKSDQAVSLKGHAH